MIEIKAKGKASLVFIVGDTSLSCRNCYRSLYRLGDDIQAVLNHRYEDGELETPQQCSLGVSLSELTIDELWSLKHTAWELASRRSDGVVLPPHFFSELS